MYSSGMSVSKNMRCCVPTYAAAYSRTLKVCGVGLMSWHGDGYGTWAWQPGLLEIQRFMGRLPIPIPKDHRDISPQAGIPEVFRWLCRDQWKTSEVGHWHGGGECMLLSRFWQGGHPRVISYKTGISLNFLSLTCLSFESEMSFMLLVNGQTWWLWVMGFTLFFIWLIIKEFWRWGLFFFFLRCLDNCFL